MKNTVFLNSEKLNFDNKLDYSLLVGITKFKEYDRSSSDEILERVKGQNIIISKELPLGRDLISRFPESVELICEAGTGYNNIDLAAAGEMNITVCNVPGYSTEAVAQLAITFILSLSSSLVQQQVMLKQGDFTNFTRALMLPHFEVQDKTLGVIGAGTIGRQVIKIAEALGMRAMVYSRSLKNLENSNARFVSLEELLRESDFVTIHTPLNSDTRHLINKERLSMMKPSAFIVNTSRGQIINEGDLIEALKKEVIAGAALDVQDPEPPELTNPLFSMKNVILTPHIGWKTLESRQRLVKILAKNINAYIEGRPVNVVK